MYGTDLYATEVYANDGETDITGKHWTKVCPQTSEWSILTPDLYTSSGCGESPAFIPQR